ncbi:DegT/DnrJ/EryC1/StrS family aminotransferase, partial [Candidatus Pelagibacter ubique]|nr:DegT/DnrJ/EryC1/StrS family aminotransferase [Candidatus Pelagibacter ubique]
KYALSCSSGTAGLHLSLMAIGVKKNDVIIMPAINFIAVYNMSKLLGAKIFLADVDPLTGQMTPDNLLHCIKVNKLKKIKAIVTMYLGGYPENILEFYKIKKLYKCILIEDACHAFGASYFFKNSFYKVGSCKHSDISVFSFHPLKTITTGEGGIVSTNNKFLAKKLLLFRSHGIEKIKNNHWKYEVKFPGFNYRISDINCSLGSSQMRRVKKFIDYRKKIFMQYRENLKFLNHVIKFPNYNFLNHHSYHLNLINIDFKKIKSSKDKFIKFMLKNNIVCQYHYVPIFKFSIYKKDKTNKIIDLKNSQKYQKNCVSLPIFYGLKSEVVKKICDKISFFVSKN